MGDAQKAQAIGRRIIDEATRLKVKEVAIVECGTAFRVLKQMTGTHPFRVVSFVELLARYLEQGRIRLETATFPGTPHLPRPLPDRAQRRGDRGAAGTSSARLTPDFVELEPNREQNWCCGGGGGLVAMGEQEFRMKSSRVKAEQMKATGAATICTACENCHTQLTDLNEHYGLGMEVESLTNLVAHALARQPAGTRG